MSEINYQVLREAAESASKINWTGLEDDLNADGYMRTLTRYIQCHSPIITLSLLDERNALNERIAELEANLAAMTEDHQKAIESIKQADSAVKLAHEKFSALAAENARLKAGAMYFSYGSEFSFECHKTAEEAIAAADAAIDDYRGDACDGWSEEVESICWGVIIQQATKVGERKKRKCDRVSPWIERVCDYELRPNVETPATDAFLAEVRAQGLEMFAQKCNSKSEQSLASDIRDNWKLLGEHATDFAAELRKGE
ncbi:ead/Ea22-like family protein [Escherichia coli]|nr:ead/Ea22-like family protein [Escherichia marmotae]MED0192047.1 ead/Ea22-like family protein [Escherichia marmotae]MED0238990.1 ead/Ea22-like family protein [Escherichia marmotae]MED0271431.1 ead/Ea22-like family protein [Escherichia coli]MED0597399.1 ead/Ea22-like family protein [Escherichia marmotae]